LRKLLFGLLVVSQKAMVPAEIEPIPGIQVRNGLPGRLDRVARDQGSSLVASKRGEQGPASLQHGANRARKRWPEARGSLQSGPGSLPFAAVKMALGQENKVKSDHVPVLQRFTGGNGRLEGIHGRGVSPEIHVHDAGAVKSQEARSRGVRSRFE